MSGELCLDVTVFMEVVDELCRCIISWIDDGFGSILSDLFSDDREMCTSEYEGIYIVDRCNVIL